MVGFPGFLLREAIGSYSVSVLPNAYIEVLACEISFVNQL